MPIFQRKDRKDEWWIDLRFEGRRIRRRSPVQTAEGAQEFHDATVVELATKASEDLDPLAGTSAYAEFTKRWMTDFVAVANRPSTQREKRIALERRLLPAFGHLKVRAISTNTVDAQAALWMREGLSMKRINNLLCILRRSLRCAVEWDLLAKAPFIRHHTYFPPVPQYLTREESDRLLEAFEPGFWRTFALFLLKTGVRFGEAAALKWEDIVLDSPRPFVTIRRAVCNDVVSDPKTKAGRRTIALIPEIVVALRVLRHNRRSNPWVFTSPTGRFLRPHGTRRVLRRACERAGVPVISWHKLRHSCATQLLEHGVPLVAIKELLGHANLDVTTIYAHVSENSMWSYMHVLSQRKEMAPASPTSWTNRIAAVANASWAMMHSQ